MHLQVRKQLSKINFLSFYFYLSKNKTTPYLFPSALTGYWLQFCKRKGKRKRYAKKEEEAKAQVEPTAHLRATSGPTSCTCRRRAEHEQQHRPRPGQHTPPGTHTSETRPPEPCTMPLPPLLFHYHLLLASVLLPIKHLRRKIATKYSVPALPFSSSVLPPLRRRRLL